MRQHHFERYEDVVLATKPVMYLPMQGTSSSYELVRNIAVTNSNAAAYGRGGPFPGCQAVEFSSSTGDNEKLAVTSNAAYHPGDTFSVGGFFNRTAQGDASASPTIFHNGGDDMTIYFPRSGNTDKLTLRKAGVSDIFATDRTFASPYSDGWIHCLFTKNAGSETLCYLDGVSVPGTYSNATIVASSTSPTFGLNASGSGNDFAGRLAHWAIWDRVLVAGEVADLYRAAYRMR